MLQLQGRLAGELRPRQVPAGCRKSAACSPQCLLPARRADSRGRSRRPGDLASPAHGSRHRGPAVRRPGAREPLAACARPWVAGCRRGERGERGRRAGAARALCSSGERCPRLAHPSLPTPLPSCGPLLAELWGGKPDGVKELLRPPAARTPPPRPHHHPFSVMQKGRCLGDILDAEGSANSAQQVPGAVTSSCP